MGDDDWMEVKEPNGGHGSLIKSIICTSLIQNKTFHSSLRYFVKSHVFVLLIRIRMKELRVGDFERLCVEHIQDSEKKQGHTEKIKPKNSLIASHHFL